MPKITVYVLQASRSIRTVWLLEELGLEYEVRFADRVNQKAPQAFKDESGSPLGKFPVLRDGDMVIHESGAIAQYLCDKYDTAHRLIPTNAHTRAQVLTFIHAAEGTLMLHALAVLYARWNLPEDVRKNQPDVLEKMEAGLGVNVQKDLDWVSKELEQSTGNFLVGNQVTAADCMMAVSARFILARKLGTGGKQWPRVVEWVERCENTEAYKRAVQKSGHTFFPETT